LTGCWRVRVKMPKKRILIIYTTAGAGHKKAAFAIKRAFDEIASGAEVDIIDSLDYTNKFFKISYPGSYILMVTRIPVIWGYAYYILDNRIVYALLSWIRHITNWINTRPLARFLREKDYDVIITTHFLPPDVISMEGKSKIRGRLINVVTDYRLHSFWVSDATDLYVVAHEKTKSDLRLKYNIPDKKIKICGIPIDPVFSKTKGRERLRGALGIEKTLFTVLIGSGGFGVGPISELVKSFKGISIPVQLLVVCGKNRALLDEIEGLKGSLGVPVKAYGFIDNMDELMEASDVIVTKTGGLMSSEALSKDLPMIGLAPIPGQESRNFNILKESGVVIGADSVKDAPSIVKRIYEDKDFKTGLHKKIASVKRPDAALEIAKLAINSE